MNEKKTEIIESLMQNEVNSIRIDGAISSINADYELSSSTMLSIVLYSQLIGFGLMETDKVAKGVEELMTTFSSFDLRDMAVTLLGADLVDYYKEIAFTDYQISNNPMIKALEETTEELESSFEDMDKVYANLSELLDQEK